MGHKDEIIKKLRREIDQLNKLRGSNDDSSLYDSKDQLCGIRQIGWAPLDEMVNEVKEVLKLVPSFEWSWARNWACKYVNIRIDMRDGHAILVSRDGRISREQLRYQYKSEEKTL